MLHVLSYIIIIIIFIVSKVRWADQQVEKIRRKRGIISTDDIETRAYTDLHFNDPLWNKEWYLVRSSKVERGHFSVIMSSEKYLSFHLSEFFCLYEDTNLRY